MHGCLLILAILGLAAVAAETKMSLAQLRSFIQSSKKNHLPDKEVAEVLKHTTLTNKLDDSTIEDLQAEGAGPRTVEALKALRGATKNLEAPPPPAPKPIVKMPDPPSGAEQEQVLKDATEYAIEYVKKLPNFICTQTTRRFGDPSGGESWRLYDTVIARLSYFEQKEDYKVFFVNNKSVDTTMEKLGGSTSTGEFGSMMFGIFTPASHAEFKWERWGTIKGRRMHVYSYRVPQEFSQWRILYEKDQSIVPGYHGLIFVDKDLLAVVRITFEADDIPATFPVQMAKSALDYDFVDISGQQFVLPLRYLMQMRTNRDMTKNEAEYHAYKKFSSEAVITYSPEPAPQN